MRDFLIVGPQNACTYKNVFPLLKDGRVAIGENHVNCLEQPDGTVKKFGNIRWYTNIGHGWSGKPLELTKSYNPDDYPEYDNYPAIEAGKNDDIPRDYYGKIGVPITFLERCYRPEWEIVGMMTGAADEVFEQGNDGRKKFYLDGKAVYARLIILKRPPVTDGH